MDNESIRISSKQVQVNGFLLCEVSGTHSYVKRRLDGNVLVQGIEGTNKFDKRITLPPGNYSIVGLAKELSEEQWKEIVDEEWFADDTVMYVDYNDDDLFFKTATESGASLLKSHGLSEATTLILKKIL